MREVTESVRDAAHEVAASEKKRFEVPEVTELTRYATRRERVVSELKVF